MANDALSVIHIDDNVLRKLDAMDEKLERTAKSSEKMAKTMVEAIDKVKNGANPLLVTLTQIAAKLDALGGASTGVNKAAQSVKGLGTSAQASAQQTNVMNMSLSRTGELLNQLSVSRPFQNMNIADLKTNIGNINRMLERQGKPMETEAGEIGNYPVFSQAEQQRLVNMRNAYQEELKIQQASESAKMTSIDRVAKAQNADALRQQRIMEQAQRQDEQALQSHLKALDRKSQAEQSYSNKLREQGEKQVQQAIKNQERIQQATTKAAPASTSVRQYTEIEAEINKLLEKHKELKQAIRDYEFNMGRINKGKSGTVSTTDISSIREERDAVMDEIVQLRKKQQSIINANLEYQKQIQLVNSLKRYEQERTGLPNQRSQATLAEMRKYYTELERTSAKAAQEAQRGAERKAAAEERAAKRAYEAWQKAYPQTQKYAMQYHNERQASLNNTFNPKNTTASMALAESKAAGTLREEANAVELLRQARLNLSRTDENYQTKLHALNDAIKQHEKNLNEAGIGAKNLQGAQRNLMDIAGQLQRRLALVFSVSQISGFIGEVAKIRGEFELQQRSLEAILQNKTEADQIFQKTVDLAIKSPFQIKDLVSFTKQLAAYRIEGDKLYDTTKRLADVSAGLGVDMQRLILAYGQVKAAAYLRGTEVRQFTEAGINMYGELQSYFREVKGEAYTTAQIVDMISKRKVTFEDVEAVFKRLTDQGGLFYNMQEIQSDTLAGKISNLKDSFDVMLNSIGKENQGVLKGAVDAAKALLDNWDKIQYVAMAVVGIVGGYVAKMTMAKFASTAIAQAWRNMKIDLAVVRTRSEKIGVLWKTFGAGITGMGFMLVLGYITSIISRMQQAKEAAAEFNKTVAENRLRIDTIGYDFRNAKATKDNTLFEQQKTQLQKLQDEAERQNIHIKAVLDNVTEDNIASVFRQAQDEINQIQDAVAFSQRRDKDSGNSDSDYKKLQEYTDAVITSSADMDAAVNTMYYSTTKEIEQQKKLLKGSKDMSDSEKKRAEETLTSLQKRADALLNIQKIQTNGAEDFDNYIKKYNALFDMSGSWMEKGGNGSMEWTSKLFTDANGDKIDVYKKYLKGINDEIAKVQAKTENMKRGWIKTFQDLKTAYPQWFKDLQSSDNKIKDMASERLRNWAESFASGENWSETGRQIFFKTLEGWNAVSRTGFKVRLDISSTDEQLQSLDKYLTEYFSKQQYMIKVNFDYGDLGKQDFGKDLLSTADTLGKAYQNVKKVADLLSRAKAYRGAKINRSQLGMEAEDWGKIMGNMMGNEVDTSYAIERLRNYQKISYRAAIDVGWEDPDAKKRTKKTAADAAKHERDIWAERISVLKEMQQQYEKVNEYFDSKTAKAMTLKEYMPDLLHVKMGEIIKPEDIVPTKQGIVNALEKVLKAMPTKLKDYFKKSSELKKNIAQLKLEIQTDEANKKLDETKKHVDELFNGLELHQRLKDVGLSEREVQAMFPGLSKTLDDVEKGIKADFAEKFKDGSYLDENTKQGKEYQDALKRNREQRIKAEQDVIVELTKAYKTQLSDQLQLDKEYYEKKAKIAESQLTPELKEQYNRNLKTDYDKKTAENQWKAFKSSDTYLTMFSGDMENMSTKTLEMMKSKLDNLKESLKNLDPSQLKEITELYKKMRSITSERSPLSSFIKDLKEIKKLKAQGLTEDNIISKISENDTENASLEAEISAINRVIQLKEKSGKLDEDDLTFVNQHKNYWDQSIPVLKSITREKQTAVETNKKENEGLNANLDTYNQTRQDVKSLKQAWAQLLQQARSAASAVSSALDAMGADADGTAGTFIDIGLNIADAIVQALLFAAALKMVGLAAKSALGIIGYILIAIEAVASILSSIFGASDKKKQKQIERLQQQVEGLQRAYDRLKESMDNAFDTTNLIKYRNETVRNLQAQIAGYQAMINTERSKKKTDQSKIQEYENNIEDARKSLKELQESFTESLGGFGSEANYKSAAQEFADAWVEAFNEGSDTLDALNDKFNDFFDNMLKKQIMMRASEKYIKPILKAFDDAVAEGSEGGNNGTDVTKNELDRINQIKDANLKAYNEFVKNMMDALGVKPSNSTSLTALQQGIQGVTESTAEALEALLNSMRFFLATQQADVATIRRILEQQFAAPATVQVQTQPVQSEDYSAQNSPIISELRTQTILIKSINALFESVVMPGHPKGRSGIRVFMD